MSWSSSNLMETQVIIIKDDQVIIDSNLKWLNKAKYSFLHENANGDCMEINAHGDW